MEATIPILQDRLPELSELTRSMARQIDTADRMAAIESAAPGWREMAAHADGAALNHITHALIALRLLPEYRHAAPAGLDGMDRSVP